MALQGLFLDDCDGDRDYFSHHALSVITKHVLPVPPLPLDCIAKALFSLLGLLGLPGRG